jgi:hemerythrin superfamily protein
MVAQARQLLSDDHDRVDEILKQLLTALDNRDVRTSYSRLDLFWARLAVHIRAEHLHLFPIVTSRLSDLPDSVVPDLSEVQAMIETLRADHDFFMRELARAIAVCRELPPNIIQAVDEAKFDAIHNTVCEVEKRLATHNDIEEDQIYRWSSTILTESEQFELLSRINAELENRPPRFSEQAWANCL